MTYRYHVFGLIMESCLEFPELIPVNGGADIPAQVRVKWGKVPDVLEEPRKSTARFQAKPGHLLLMAENAARVLISHGSEILVELLPGAEAASVRSFILGSALGAVLHQRQLLPLHASGIKTGDGCVMFCGRPGTGKSTIAGLFVQRGYALHADDLCVIGVNKEGIPLVFPGYPQLKLWGDALEKMGSQPSAYLPLHWLPDKFAVPTPRFNREPLPIKKIFILFPHDKDRIEITPVTGIDKYKALRFQTYRRRFPGGLGTAGDHFNTAGCVVKQVPMYRVHRPKNLFLLNELADLLEKNFY